MAKYDDYLTASDYYKFLNCPHWPYYERFHTEEEGFLKREMTEGEKQRLEDGLKHEEEVIRALYADKNIKKQIPTGDPEFDSEATIKLMREGVEYIYQGTLTHNDWTGRPDLLMKIQGNSDLGDWYYVPIDIKSAHYVQKYHRLQLMFYAVLLEALQGRFPGRGYIINKDGEQHEIELGDYVIEFNEITAELEAIRAGEKPDPVLRKSCFDVGPWGALCKEYAIGSNDIAQLFNVDIRKLKALRELGIRTLTDAAKMNIADIDGRMPGLRAHGLMVAKMQARALLERKVIIREPIHLNTPLMEIHFDIESDPPNDFDYLYGIFIRTKEKSEYKAFVARNIDEEKEMWNNFLNWIETLTVSYQVIHYANYEKVRLAVLEKRYGGSVALDRFRDNMIDIKQVITHSVVFPLHFYGLKYVAPFLGFSWRGEVKSGGQSVDIFEEFLKTKNEDLLNQIIVYNEDDVRATAVIADWCRNYASKLTEYNEPYPWEKGIKLGTYKI